MKMKAAIAREYNKPISVEEVELAPPKEKEVLVKTSYCGFCHSDLSLIKGHFQFPLPAVMGHEASGVVMDVGPGVTKLQKGDHVVGTWMISCGDCPECAKGWGNLCRTNLSGVHEGTLLDMTSRLTDAEGNTLRHSTFVSGFAEYMVLPEEGAIKVRKDMPLDQACFLGCCMPTGFGSAVNVGKVNAGESVAIWGMGGVGLNVVQGCKMRGAYPIIGVDLEGSKEAIAREFGATHFIDSSKEDPVPIIQELTNGGANYCFEVIGDSGAGKQCFWSLGLKGKMVQVGGPHPEDMADIPFIFLGIHCQSVEGTVYGNIRTHEDIPKFIDMVMRGDYKLDKLLGKYFKLDEINDVVDAMEKRQIIGRWVCAFE